MYSDMGTRSQVHREREPRGREELCTVTHGEVWCGLNNERAGEGWEPEGARSCRAWDRKDGISRAMQSCGCFLKGRKCSFVKVNPRKVAALDAFVTLLWDSGPALAQGWRRNALSPTAGALTQSLRASLQVVGTSKHLKAKDKRDI